MEQEEQGKDGHEAGVVVGGGGDDVQQQQQQEQQQGHKEEEEEEEKRKLAKMNDAKFVLDLEFVELLSNPFYLLHLAQSRLFADHAFLNYIEYLQYWRMKPSYAKHVSHPHALYFLEMLQKPEFREALLDPSYANLIHTQQFWHWKSWRLNRFRQWESCARGDAEKQQQQQAAEDGQEQEQQQEYAAQEEEELQVVKGQKEPKQQK